MRPETNDQALRQGHRRAEQNRNDKRNMHPGMGGGAAQQVIDWTLLGMRVRQYLRRLWNALTYRAGRSDLATAGIPSAKKRRLPWFRLGLAAVVVFVLTQKDLHFSVEMRSQEEQAAAAASARPASHTAGTEEMSLVPSPVAGKKTAAERPGKAFDVNSLDAAAVRSYIQRFERVALTEERKFGVPAPVKMAMAIHGSQGGMAPVAAEHHNHFGPVMGERFFDSAWANWRAHSEYMREQFGELSRRHRTDYKQYLQALGKSGYSNDPAYAANLKQIIDRFDLDELGTEW